MPDPYITEAYLQQQIEQKAAQAICCVMLDLACGTGAYGARISSVRPDQDYTKNRTFNGYVAGYGHTGTRRWFSVAFGAPVYDTQNSGVVNTGPPHILQSGEVSTGQYQRIGNRTSEPIGHEIKKTVEESQGSEVSITESLELKSGVTVEAGTDAAKVSAALETTFGISKSSTQDHSTTVGEEIDDTITIDPDEEVATVYTEDRGVVDQGVQIEAPLDWGRITIGTSTLGYDSGPNSPYLYASANHALWDKTEGSQQWFHVNSWVALGSLLRGYDIRATTELRRWYEGHRSADARSAMDTMDGVMLRRLSFSGNRRSSDNKSASYVAYVVTGWDDQKIHETFGTDGEPVDDLDKLAKRK